MSGSKLKRKRTMSSALLKHEKALLFHTVRQRTRETPLLTITGPSMAGNEEKVSFHSVVPCDVAKDRKRMPVNIVVAGGSAFDKHRTQILLDKANRRAAPIYVIDMMCNSDTTDKRKSPTTSAEALDRAKKTLVSEVAIVFRFFQNDQIDDISHPRNENNSNKSPDAHTLKRKRSEQCCFSLVEIDDDEDNQMATHPAETRETEKGEDVEKARVKKKTKTCVSACLPPPVLPSSPPTQDVVAKRIAENILSTCQGTLLTHEKAFSVVKRFLKVRNSDFLQGLTATTTTNTDKKYPIDSLLSRRAFLLRALITDPDFALVSFPNTAAERQAGILNVRCGSGITQENIFSVIGMLLELSNAQKDLSRLIDVHKGFIHFDGRSASWFLTELGLALFKPTLLTWEAFESEFKNDRKQEK